MVHAEVRPLLALGLQGLEKAKRLFVWRLVAHFVTLGFLIISAMALSSHENEQTTVSTLVELGSAGLAVASEFVALVLHHHAMELHCLSREVMRRVMLMDAKRPEDAPAFCEHIKNQFSKNVQGHAARMVHNDERLREDDQRLASYYMSNRPPTDSKRLRDHLLESAIFSHHLYSAAWKFSLVIMLIFLLAAVVIWSFLIFDKGILAIRILVALLSFLPLSQELDHMLLYRIMAKQLGDLLVRLERLYGANISPEQLDLRLVADFGDYGAATTFAPPIRTAVYLTLVERLRTETAKKLDELSEREESAASRKV